MARRGINSCSGRQRFVARYKAYDDRELLLGELAEMGEWSLHALRRGSGTEYTFVFRYPIDPEPHVGSGPTANRAVIQALRSWVQEAK